MLAATTAQTGHFGRSEGVAQACLYFASKKPIPSPFRKKWAPGETLHGASRPARAAKGLPAQPRPT